MNKIPKIIHYCWFGKNPKTELINKCISSWKEKLPDYTIIEWNEENFDINMNEYVRQAYENKRWAFVSDYVRLYALYNMGGIYLDTDMEVLKNFDNFLNDEVFIGCEQDEVVNGAIIGSCKYNYFIRSIMNKYETEVNDTSQTIPVIITNYLKSKNFKNCIDVIKLDNEIVIYPKDYFYPKDVVTHRLNITENTVCIHHYSASWMNLYQKIRCYILSNIYKVYKTITTNIYRRRNND